MRDKRLDLLTLVGEHQPATSHALSRELLRVGIQDVDTGEELALLCSEELLFADGDLMAIKTSFSRTEKGSALLPLVNQFVDLERWEQALRDCGDVAKNAMIKPATIAQLGAASYVEDMRANGLVLRRYLELIGMATNSRSIPGGSYCQRVHHGDLIVDGDFRFEASAGESTIVTGDLIVNGLVTGVAFEGRLIVGGNLRCNAIVTDADVAIGGELLCQYARLGWYDCNVIFGQLRAKVFIDHGMCLECPVEAALHLFCEDHCESLEPEHEAELKVSLPPDIFNTIFSGLDSNDEDRLDKAYKRLDEVMLAARGMPTVL